MTENESQSQKSLLVIIFDTNPAQKIWKNNPGLFTQCLDAVIAFGNAHLMQKAENSLTIIACHGGFSQFVYPDFDNQLDVRQMDGQYEVFTLVEKTVKQNMAKLLDSDSCVVGKESLLSGALSMALCYISRIVKNQLNESEINSRILIVSGSHDSITQYMNYMNIFFTAQKKQIVLDVCSLEYDLNLFQQGCDITNGHYLKVPQLQGLLEYLLWIFLPEPPIRKKLVLPPPVQVDYRAACFCHRELIDIGYVCSVCLSIFCKFSPICTTCHTVFKMPGPLPGKAKKKKK